MSEPTPSIPPVLESAWKRFADYDNTAKQQQNQFYLLRRWVLYFSIAATLIAILIENFRTFFPPFLVTGLQIILIALPIGGSVTIAFLGEFKQGQKYLTMRTGAEEIKKEIYIYRTVMQANPERKKWLFARIAEIQRQVHRSSGGEVVVKPYKGEFPNPNYNPNDSASDEGISDLTAEQYLNLRLVDQLEWHTRKIEAHQNQRKLFIFLILIAGGVGSLLASVDFILNGIAVGVALATAVLSAITNWKELLGLDMVVANYSKVILELSILRDHWLSLEPHERTQSEFFKLVKTTEKVLWDQNIQFISAMRESLDDTEAEQQRIVQDMIGMSREVAGQVQEQIIEEARLSMEEAVIATAADGLLMDEQRLPQGTIFNVALGPALSVLTDNDEDAPDGFAEFAPQQETPPPPSIELEQEATSEKPNDDDPVLAAINLAVAAAIEESDAVKSSEQEKKPSPAELIEDEATKAAQEAANQYIQDATDAFNFEED